MPTYRGADGTELHYDVRDSRPDPATGTAIVALAGGPARHPDYLGDLAGLDTRHELILPHLRGVGRSPLPPPPPPHHQAPASLQASSSSEASSSSQASSWHRASSWHQASYWHQAEDLEARRTELGIDRIHLLGHSAGTRMALSYAVRHPSHVASLTLVTPPADYLTGVTSDAPELRARYRTQPWYAAAAAAAAEGLTADDDQALTEFYARVAPFGYAVWNDTARAHATVGPLNAAATRAYYSADPVAELRAGLGTVTAPVLVIAGDRDALTGRAPVEALPALFPHGRLSLIENCGHFPWVEQPAAFRAALDAFLPAP